MCICCKLGMETLLTWNIILLNSVSYLLQTKSIDLQGKSKPKTCKGWYRINLKCNHALVFTRKLDNYI